MTSAIERDLVIVACAVSAGIHAALVPEHLRERAGAGSGFLTAVLLLGGLAAVLTRRPYHTGALVAAAVVFAGLLGSYALAVTTGVPVLHPAIEPVDGLAFATKIAETVGLVAAVHLLWPGLAVPGLTFLRSKGTTT